jgi:hypothetical protein
MYKQLLCAKANSYSLTWSPGALAQQGRAILRPLAPPIRTPQHPSQPEQDRTVQLGVQICYTQAGLSYWV